MTNKTTPDPWPLADDAAQKVRQLIGDAVRAAVPADAMMERQVRPDSKNTWLAPFPMAGFMAARHVRKLAEGHMYRYVAELRGHGAYSWQHIADLLEIPWTGEYSRVERAFELTAAAVGHNSTWSGPRIYWYCDSCDQHITDRGPYNGHPVDNESGHADDCRRVARETADYDRKCEEDEQRARVMDEAYALLDGDSFGRSTADRARYVRAHGGHYLGWSTSERLAVALVLGDDDELAQCGYSTRAGAIERVFGGSAKPPPNMDVWLAYVRAAATGTPADG